MLSQIIVTKSCILLQIPFGTSVASESVLSLAVPPAVSLDAENTKVI